MKLRHFVGLSMLAFGLTLGGASHADWAKTEAFEYAPNARTTLKIADPHGAKAFVTIGSETKEETLPAIFALPDADAYITVKIVASDGDTWNGKVEVKAHKQTIVKFTHTPKPAAAAAPAPQAPAHKFIGSLKNCSKDSVKFVAMRDGKSAYETSLSKRQMQANVELEAGTYSLRIFKNNVFFTAVELVVSRDGWVHGWQC